MYTCWNLALTFASEECFVEAQREVPVCMYVCMYCMYVRVHVCVLQKNVLSKHKGKSLCVCMYVCMCIYMYVSMHVWVFVCTHNKYELLENPLCVCMYVCMYVCMHVPVCMYAWVYVCIHMNKYEAL
jgi:hypothetical protein